jgi:AraC-like DNA-binding protein/mannose-6-phosphate isomerase-like protein (cupin superfamily)
MTPPITAGTTQTAAEKRIQKNPSSDARNIFFYLQECGRRNIAGTPWGSRQAHPSFLCAIVLEGAGFLQYEAEQYRLKNGDCFFLDSRRNYHCQNTPEHPLEILWVQFSGSSSEGYYQLFRKQHEAVFHPAAAARITSVMQEIIHINEESLPETEILTSKFITDLLTLLLTVSISADADSALYTKLKSIRAYLDQNYTKDIHLDEISKTFDISKYYLTREFKRAYGVTIFQHIIQLRIEYAKRLLRQTDKSVEEISAACGFNDQSYFSKQFKKSENITCLAFRRRSRS